MRPAGVGSGGRSTPQSFSISATSRAPSPGARMSVERPLLISSRGIVAQQALGGRVHIGEAAVQADGDHRRAGRVEDLAAMVRRLGGSRTRERRHCRLGMRKASSTAAAQAASISSQSKRGPATRRSHNRAGSQQKARTARTDQRMKAPLGTARCRAAIYRLLAILLGWVPHGSPRCFKQRFPVQQSACPPPAALICK